MVDTKTKANAIPEKGNTQASMAMIVPVLRVKITESGAFSVKCHAFMHTMFLLHIPEIRPNPTMRT